MAYSNTTAFLFRQKRNNLSLVTIYCRNYTEVFRTLIENAAAVDLKTETGHTALHYAAHLGHSTYVRTLLERGADVDARVSTLYKFIHAKIIFLCM